MKGELYINGKDAYTTYSVSLLSGSLASLMTPPEVKDMVSNKSRLEDGVRYTIPSGSIKYNERDVTLVFWIAAKDRTTFASKMAAFLDVMTDGEVIISTKYESGKYYHLYYKSSSSYAGVDATCAKFSVKFTEPNPNNRT